MASIQIKRRSEWINRMRNLQLILDGKPLGKIANGETKTFRITPGQHTLKSTIDWAGSPEIVFEAKAGEMKTIEVKAFSGSKWLLYSAMLGFPFFFLLLLFPDLSTKFPFLGNAFMLVMLPSFLLLLYRLMVGRNGYLELKVAEPLPEMK